MRKLLMIIPMSLMLFVGGCTEEQDQTQKELAGILKDIQEYETKVVEYENQLAMLEKKEQILFNKTVEFTMEERELIESGVSRMETSLKERKKLITEELGVINDAEEAAKRLESLPTETSDEATGAIAKLKTALSKRFELHYEIVNLYSELTERQSSLYELLIEENVKRVELEGATVAVNKQREKLEDATLVFNQSTMEVNKALKETQQVESE
ncbi:MULTISPECIES: YkyA family protein [unclassified Sporosarcina]|uniref:YkyA family protein n=1 Tax=unclassified Sporosarcina TaxID=2647733 RepID=UPI00057A38DF|nr:YkyA family protein [Sporosarcina sp. ZBG7A]